MIDPLDEAGLGGPKDTLFSRLWRLWTTASMAGAIAGDTFFVARKTRSPFQLFLGLAIGDYQARTKPGRCHKWSKRGDEPDRNGDGVRISNCIREMLNKVI